MNWVTRARPRTDGVACSWLIHRFIDPVADILYVPVDQVLTVARCENARSFDAPGAEFGPHDGTCTFEVLVDHLQLGGDPALARLSRIVHAAVVTADLGAEPLALGLLAISQGGLDVEANDRWLAERGMFVYDALYAWCQRHADPGRPVSDP